MATGKRAFLKLHSLADRKPTEAGHSFKVDTKDRRIIEFSYSTHSFTGLPRFSSTNKLRNSLYAIDKDALIDYLEVGFI